EGIWEEATFGQIRYEQEHGEALYRRSLYTFWRRIVGPTMFFDVANRQTCTVRVARTNTPLHALVTLNDVTFVEAARGLAEAACAGRAREQRHRFNECFRRVLARGPRPAEQQLLIGRLDALRTVYRGDAEAAKKLIASGESKPDPQLDPVELAAYTALGT